MISLSSPLKNDPPETTVSIFFFSKLRYSNNQNSRLKKYEKNLSSASVDDERPQNFLVTEGF